SNLAVHLAANGVRVLAVDADMGLANLHLLLGMRPRATVMEVIERGAGLDEIAETGPVGLRLAAGGSGLTQMADLHPAPLRRLAGKCLGRQLLRRGHVLDDARAPASIAARLPILLNQPAAPAAACLRGIGRSLLLEIGSRRAAEGSRTAGVPRAG